MTKVVCVACRHSIDAAARICPYCGADPTSGQKVDTQALLQEVFRPREVTTSDSVIEYARQRQGVVIGGTVVVIFLILTALHQFVTARNESAVSTAQAVPLTEITDLSNQPEETKPMAMPDLDFQYDGRPQAMRTFIVEAGAVTPPEVIAAQQAAQQAPQTPATATVSPAPSAAAPAPPPPPAQ